MKLDGWGMQHSTESVSKVSSLLVPTIAFPGSLFVESIQKISIDNNFSLLHKFGTKKQLLLHMQRSHLL